MLYSRRMWIVRSLARLALYVAVAVAVALVLAAVDAAVRPVGFHHGLWVACYAVGLLYAVLGALGGSSFGRVSDAKGRTRMLGRVPGAASWTTLTAATADEPQLTVTAVLLLGGAALIGLGVLLQLY